MKRLRRQRLATKFALLFVAFAVVLSCGGHDESQSADARDLCNCRPNEPPAEDFRHAEKHVPLPNVPATPVNLETILSWEQDDNVPEGPRHDRENTLFQVSHAYLQWASVQNGDCDLHLEISATPDKNAPRVIVETPVDAEYCPARRDIQSRLKQRGFSLSETDGGELSQPIPVTVVGLAFQDRGHNRGTEQVATTWELHPAIVTPQ